MASGIVRGCSLKVKTKTISGTTNSLGNILATDVNLNVRNVMVLAFQCTSNGNYAIIPFVTASGGHYGRLVNIASTSMNTLVNTHYAATIYYIEIS